MPDSHKSLTKKFEAILKQSIKPKYQLVLYIAGSTLNSAKALANIKKICEEKLHDRYELKVIDLYRKPRLTKEEQIIAAPTLVKKFPLPMRRIIGDLSNTERVLRSLDIKSLTQPGDSILP